MARLSQRNFRNHSAAFPRTAVLASLAACAALTLSGCGSVPAGSIPVSVADGAYGQAGDILLRNVFVLGPAPGQTIPKNGKASLFAGIVNDGNRPDRLVRATAPGFAGQVAITGGKLDAPVHQLVGTGPAPPLTLTKLAAPLRGNPTVRITLTFQDAGPVSLKVPVQTAQGPFTTFSPPAAPASPSH